MGNPLACAIANASLDLLDAGHWRQQVADIEKSLHAGLEPCRGIPGVADVRVLGAIGVVEMKQPIDLQVVGALLPFHLFVGAFKQCPPGLPEIR